MRTVAVIQPGELKIVEIPMPEVGPYDVLVRTEVSFICNATDRKVIDGHFPGLGPENYPLLLGHESVGTVVKTGPKVRSFSIGDRTIGGLLLNPPGGVYGSGWGGHSEYVVINDHEAMAADGVADAEHGWDDSLQIMRTVPGDIPLESAGLLCTWREVYAGLFTDFRMREGDSLMVFGAGPVGLSFVKFARLFGAGTVVSIDVLENKREKALAMGADAAFHPDDPNLAGYRRDRGAGFDLVVDAVGRESIINAALPMVKMGGTIGIYGVLSEPVIALSKSEGPLNFDLIVHQWPTREAEAAAQEPLIEWIRAGSLDWRDFVTARFPVTRIAEAVEAVREPTAIKTMLLLDDWG